MPATLYYDGSDDLLDPTRGFRLGGRLSPEISARGERFGYARAQIDGSAYLPVAASTVLAGRVRLGSIVGADAPSIAPSRRFYSGGGGSVRGYGYQRLGPRDFEGDPIGGRGLAEFSLEARVRFGSFGVVPFLDGGSLANRITPEFKRLAVRRRHRPSLLFVVRADPGRRRHPAQPARWRQPDRGGGVARAGLLTEEAATREDAPPEPPRYRLKRNWARRLWQELLALLVALLLLLVVGLVMLDTAPGHRFIVDRIAQVETATGLKFRIGRIEGSIFGKLAAYGTSR